jgi:hypothetical protein
VNGIYDPPDAFVRPWLDERIVVVGYEMTKIAGEPHAWFAIGSGIQGDIFLWMPPERNHARVMFPAGLGHPWPSKQESEAQSAAVNDLIDIHGSCAVPPPPLALSVPAAPPGPAAPPAAAAAPAVSPAAAAPPPPAPTLMRRIINYITGEGQRPVPPPQPVAQPVSSPSQPPPPPQQQSPAPAPRDAQPATIFLTIYFTPWDRTLAPAAAGQNAAP